MRLRRSQRTQVPQILNNSVKVLTVVGARPQFIKASPVSRALKQAGLEEYLLHTGQHYDREMSEVFFEEMGMRPPDCNLNVGSGSHAAQTAAMLTGIEAAIQNERPNWVLIYGDTNSTLAAALAASKLNVPVAHVESGLRSFNRRMPEEVNRIVADALGTVLFAPTDLAVENLRREGVPPNRICQVGDVMYDGTLMFLESALRTSTLLTRLGLPEKGYVLATIHRAENTDDDTRLAAIVSGLSLVAAQLPVLLPLHPRTRHRLERAPMLDVGKLMITEPLGFLDMIRAEAGAALIATDSGGVQKEAFFHRVPCVTLRDETEWVELVDLGWNRVCPPTGKDVVANAIFAGLNTSGRAANPYGTGTAAVAICDRLAAI